MRDEALQKPFQKHHDSIDIRSGCKRLQCLTQLFDIPSRLALRGQRPLEFLWVMWMNLIHLVFPLIHCWYHAEKNNRLHGVCD